MSKVFTIGEILVEIMASKIGQPFDSTRVSGTALIPVVRPLFLSTR